MVGVGWDALQRRIGLICFVLSLLAAITTAQDPFVASYEFSTPFNSTGIRIRGGNLPSSQTAFNNLNISVQLDVASCANITWVSSTALDCTFSSPHPYESVSVFGAPLSIFLRNFTIDSVPVALFNTSSNGTLIPTQPGSAIRVATLRPNPVITNDTYLVSTEGAGVQIGIGGLYFSNRASDIAVSIRTSYSPEFPCVIQQTTSQFLVCNVTTAQELQLSAGPIEARIVVQGGVSSGWAEIGYDLPPLVQSLSMADIDNAESADTSSFVIEGFFFAPLQGRNVRVDISQQERVPVALQVPCDVSSATTTVIVCEIPSNATRQWVAGTLRAIVSIIIPQYLDAPFLSSSSPIAVIKPALSLFPPQVPLTSGINIVNFTGNGFVPPDTSGLSAVSLLWRFEGNVTSQPCNIVAAGPNYISCRMPLDIVAGRLEALVSVVTNVSLDLDSNPVTNVTLSSEWTSTLDLLPSISPTLSIIYLDEINSETVSFTLQGFGFSPLASENVVLLSSGSGAGSVCNINRTSARSITCNVVKSSLSNGNVFAVVRVRGVSSRPEQIAVIASTFSLVPRGANITPSGISAGGIAAIIIVIALIIAAAILIFTFRDKIQEAASKLKKKVQTPATYEAQPDKVSVAEVLSALTPEGENMEISVADVGTPAAAEPTEAAAASEESDNAKSSSAASSD